MGGDWSWADFILGVVAGVAVAWIAYVVSQARGADDREEHFR